MLVLDIIFISILLGLDIWFIIISIKNIKTLFQDLNKWFDYVLIIGGIVSLLYIIILLNFTVIKLYVKL